MPRTKKKEEVAEVVEEVVEEVVQVYPFTIDASFTSVSGETVNFKARKFVPISDIAVACEQIASAVVSKDGYFPYLEEFLIWTTIVNLYTDLEVDALIEEDADHWYEELTCSNLKTVLQGIVMFSQYTLIELSARDMIEHSLANKKSSLDVLIDTFLGDGLLFDLLEKITSNEMEGAEENVQLS